MPRRVDDRFDGLDHPSLQFATHDLRALGRRYQRNAKRRDDGASTTRVADVHFALMREFVRNVAFIDDAAGREYERAGFHRMGAHGRMPPERGMVAVPLFKLRTGAERKCAGKDGECLPQVRSWLP